jgi:predicted transcriptional regulator
MAAATPLSMYAASTLSQSLAAQVTADQAGLFHVVCKCTHVIAALAEWLLNSCHMTACSSSLSWCVELIVKHVSWLVQDTG